MNKFDSNKDNKLTLAELVDGYHKLAAEAGHTGQDVEDQVTEIERLFPASDKNRDGKLELHEIEHLLMHSTLPDQPELQEFIVDIMTKFDSDHDDRLTIHEMMEGIHALADEDGHSHEEGDGKLDLMELKVLQSLHHHEELTHGGEL